MIQRTRQRFAIVLMFVAATAVGRAAQDSLAHAKVLYASAAYDEALQVLGKLPSGASPAETRDAAVYRVFCLVALGRSFEAHDAIEAIVQADPLYRPSDADASPRVQALFDEVRKPLLPELARQSYAKGRAAFERKDMATASLELDRTIALLDDKAMAGGPGVADLRTLAAGFRDLSRMAQRPATPPPSAVATAPAAGGSTQMAADPAVKPAPSASSPAAPPPSTTPAPILPAPPPQTSHDPPGTFTVADTDVAIPEPITRPMPPWHPANAFLARQVFRGELSLLIDAQGAVVSASISKPIYPTYDITLLEMAKTWKFKPAMRSGTPVMYRYLMNVTLQDNTPPGRH